MIGGRPEDNVAALQVAESHLASPQGRGASDAGPQQYDGEADATA